MKIQSHLFHHLILVIIIALGSTSATAAETIPIEDATGKSRIVGINYSTWHTLAYDGTKPGELRNLQKILAEDAKQPPAFGPEQSWHFWAEPAIGYYRGDDVLAMNYHFDLFEEAMIDYIVLDATNVIPSSPYKNSYLYEPLDKMLPLIEERAARGRSSPKIILWSPSALAGELFEKYYSKPQYAKHWLHLDDGSGVKPMFITTDSFDKIDPKISNTLTIRRMWGLRSNLEKNEWSFLHKHPQPVAKKADQSPEQIVVCVASQATYMTDTRTATPRHQGKTFQDQWSRAFEIQPQFVTITWWNELMAQRQKDGPKGEAQFVDMYTPEYSRDIEPVKSPYGDMYYRFMRDYIKAYKSGQPMPKNLLEKHDKGTDRTDFDMDGIPNNIEGNRDTDSDGIADQWDLDSDNDGIPDWREKSRSIR